MTGALSSRLRDIWVANGKPERIGYAATNGYVDAGTRDVATDSTCCAGGAMGLYESGGRLYGRWCAIEGVAYHADSVEVGLEQSLELPFLYGTRSSPAQISPRLWVNTSGYDQVVVFRWHVSDAGAAHMPVGDYMIGLSAQAGNSIDVQTRVNNWLMSANGGVGDVQISGTVTGTWRNPAVVATGTYLAGLRDRVVAVNLASAGVPWLTANVWSRSGEWVRRKTWADSNKMLRHEAGPGSARAVAVLKSSTAAARPVRNTEFGVAEFCALDWAMKYPPAAGDVDLTDAMIAVDALNWVLWKSEATVPDPVVTDKRSCCGGGYVIVNGVRQECTDKTPDSQRGGTLTQYFNPATGLDEYCQEAPVPTPSPDPTPSTGCCGCP